jgi:lipopolysaccharide transport system permease protein
MGDTRAEQIGYVVRPSSGWGIRYFRDMYDFRELLFFLTWRDIKVRYKQTVLGASWAIIQPFFTMIVFTIFFGKLAKIPSDGVPYPIFTYCALLPWTLFAFSLTQSSNSLVSEQNLITKAYFPRVLVLFSSIATGLVDFCIAFLVLVLMIVYYDYPFSVRLIYLPVFVGFALATALAIGLWLSALNVKYRDVRYTVPFITQFWLFASPVAYSSSLIPEEWRWVYGLNPMAGVIEGFRWCLLDGPVASGSMMGLSALVVLTLLAGGLIHFQRLERVFADVI